MKGTVISLMALFVLICSPAIAGEAGEGNTAIVWKTWEEGLPAAKAEQRPILLYVYSSTCPKCRELIASFADPEIVRLAKRFVMIRQDADLDPPWLKEGFYILAEYVPRIYFLKPDGTVLEEVTSRYAEYPYFYSPSDLAALINNMKKLSR